MTTKTTTPKATRTPKGTVRKTTKATLATKATKAAPKVPNATKVRTLAKAAHVDVLAEQAATHNLASKAANTSRSLLKFADLFPKVRNVADTKGVVAAYAKANGASIDPTRVSKARNAGRVVIAFDAKAAKFPTKWNADDMATLHNIGQTKAAADAILGLMTKADTSTALMVSVAEYTKATKASAKATRDAKAAKSPKVDPKADAKAAPRDAATLAADALANLRRAAKADGTVDAAGKAALFAAVAAL
jgi:hypothetical protein